MALTCTKYFPRRRHNVVYGGWDYLEALYGPGPCQVFFNVRIFTYRVTTHPLHTVPFIVM